MPDAPTAGLVGVLRLGLGLLATVVEAAGPVVSSAVLSSLEALSEVVDWALQELRSPTINATKSILLKSMLHKKLCLPNLCT
jgi:hypothetical protein